MALITPPRWAEAILATLLPGDTRESVIGDFLEEYRESKVPELGVRRANAWYLRQVAAAAWRLAAVFCFALLLVHAWREAIDELVLVADYHTRSAILSYSMMAGYASGGLWAGWRTGRIASGALTSVLSSFVGWSGAWLVALSLGLLGMDRFHPGGADELFLLPIMTLPIVVALGLIGAAAGSVARRLSRTAAGA